MWKRLGAQCWRKLCKFVLHIFFFSALNPKMSSWRQSTMPKRRSRVVQAPLARGVWNNMKQQKIQWNNSMTSQFLTSCGFHVFFVFYKWFSIIVLSKPLWSTVFGCSGYVRFFFETRPSLRRGQTRKAEFETQWVEGDCFCIVVAWWPGFAEFFFFLFVIYNY